MKIYQVTAYDNAYCWYFYGTKREADAAARRLRVDYADTEYPDATIEVQALDVAATRAGIAGVLNDFVCIHCLNEH